MSDLIVAVADSPFPSLDPVEKVLRPLGARLSVSASSAASDILAVARDADALLVCYAKLPGDLIRELTRCKVIGRTGLGVDNIDLAAARERKIVVTYVPDYCMDEVSDHAMALMLALARKVPFANSLVQGGRWEMAAVAPIHRTQGPNAGPCGLREYPSRSCAEGQGVRPSSSSLTIPSSRKTCLLRLASRALASTRCSPLPTSSPFTLRSRLRREVSSTQARSPR